MRIAILCSGLDSVRRGYEVHCRLLFTRLRADLAGTAEVLLFKRDGAAAEGEARLTVPSRRSRLCGLLGRLRGDAYAWESLFFAAAFLVHTVLLGRRYDRLLTLDATLARMLHRFRRVLPGAPRLLFTHGVWMDPEHYLGIADRIQEVNVENFRRSSSRPGGRSRVRLLPHFLPRTPLGAGGGEKARLRERYGIGTPLVALSVGVVKRPHKRMDYVIEEAERMPAEWGLVLCGAPEDGALLDHARERLGDRFRHLYVPPEDIDAVYRMADLFVLGATQEGFGLVVVEAMRAGLPVAVHDRELFRWIVQDPEACIDMNATGRLANFVRDHASDGAWRRAKGERNRRVFEERFSWDGLRGEYLDFILAP
ncbi:MAG: glycosyltransferase family 4 protein [Planctomycetes bacterium]|nr:glycosyltransferase family 4 protein [Planctomycetota bacterium]